MGEAAEPLKPKLIAHFAGIGTFPFAMHGLVGLITIYVFRQHGTVTLIWLASLAFCLLAQTLLVHRFHAGKGISAQTTITLFTALNGGVGLAWGIAAWLYLDPDGIEQTLFFVFVTGGLIISSVATQHMMLRFCFSAIFPAYTLLIALLLIKPFPNGFEMAVLLVLFCVVMGELARRLQSLLLGKIEIETEKDVLLTQLESSLAQLREAQADRAEFLSQASHDLRQPVHAAALLTEALTKQPSAKLFGQLQSAIGNLVSMFDSLMELSLFEGGKLNAVSEPVEVGPILLEVCESFAAAAEKADVELRLVDTQSVVLADSAQLKRILVNLVGNAVRYAPGSALLVGVRRRGDQVFIHVIDTGPGIPEADQQTVFRAFSRLNANGGSHGLGLGLNIVANSAAAMGAECTLCRGPGGGCNFAVGPFQKTVLKTSPHTIAYPASTALGHAVIVDDKEDVARALAAAMTTWGYEVTYYTSTEHMPADVPADVLIFDNDLGDHVPDGLDLLQSYRSQTPTPPAAILITGSVSQDLQARAKALDIPVLSKPVHPAKLRSTLLGARVD